MVGIGIKQPCPSTKSWMYFPERQLPVLSRDVPEQLLAVHDAGQGHALLAAVRDELQRVQAGRWQATIVEDTIQGLINAGMIKEEDRKDIVDTWVFHADYSYPTPQRRARRHPGAGDPVPRRARHLLPRPLRHVEVRSLQHRSHADAGRGAGQPPAAGRARDARSASSTRARSTAATRPSTSASKSPARATRRRPPSGRRTRRRRPARRRRSSASSSSSTPTSPATRPRCTCRKRNWA